MSSKLTFVARRGPLSKAIWARIGRVELWKAMGPSNHDQAGGRSSKGPEKGQLVPAKTVMVPGPPRPPRDPPKGAKIDPRARIRGAWPRKIGRSGPNFLIKTRSKNVTSKGTPLDAPKKGVFGPFWAPQRPPQGGPQDPPFGAKIGHFWAILGAF